MLTNRLAILVFFLIVSGMTAPIAWGQTGANDLIGTWTNAEKDARFLISKQGEKFSGKMIWIKDPAINGKPAVDEKNPVVAFRSRPLLGLTLLDGFNYVGDNVWSDGKIYDPRNGKTYSCKMTLTDPKHLSVRGYVGFSLLGRTDVWTRVD